MTLEGTSVGNEVNASSYEFSYPVGHNSPYQLHLNDFRHSLDENALINLFYLVNRGLQEKVGQEIPTPQRFEQRCNYYALPGYLLFTWYNQCGEVYGSWEDLILIANAIQLVTTHPMIMPFVVQNRSCHYNVYRDMGPGAERVWVGYGEIKGTSLGSEVE